MTSESPETYTQPFAVSSPNRERPFRLPPCTCTTADASRPFRLPPCTCTTADASRPFRLPPCTCTPTHASPAFPTHFFPHSWSLFSHASPGTSNGTSPDILGSSSRHSRESGNPRGAPFLEETQGDEIPAFAGMTIGAGE